MNTTARWRPGDPSVTLHQLFERQARRTPHRPAVTFGETTLTYRELDDRAGRLAAGLKQQGVTLESVVGVCAHRSLDQIVALIAIMKAGAAYAPLDPGLPDDRLAFMIEDLGCALVLAQPADYDRVAVMVPRRARPLDRPGRPGELQPDPSGPWPGAGPGNLAFIVYTSGSTGMPKAILSLHQGSVDFVQWIIGLTGLTGADVICQLSAHGYDAWVWELFAPLAVGGRVVGFPQSSPIDIDALANLFESSGVTVAHFVPPVLHLLCDLRPGFAAGLRWICCSGEPLPMALVRRLAESSPAKVVNLYGATEATIDQTYYACSGAEDGESVPAGRAVARMTAVVLDEALRPLPDGKEGEVFVSGSGVTRGYLNRPRLTAERFLPDPVSDGDRMYRTGDLGRIRPDGELEYLGRGDAQVKIAGVRVELGEVEAILAAHPGIAHACAVVSTDGRSVDAFLVGRSGQQAGPAGLRSWLAAKLPRHLVPTGLYWLDRLPLTSAGKVDRAALRDHPVRARNGTGVAARDELERVILDIWRRCLDAQRIGVQDGFFELGGSSLTAAQVLTEVRDAFGLPLPLTAIYDAPTVADLAQLVREFQQALAAVADVADSAAAGEPAVARECP